MFKAKIRGTFTTALTKLLLDEGFQIVEPSLDAQERLGLRYGQGPGDIDIRDRSDRQGVEAHGQVEAVEAFHTVLKETFTDVVVRRCSTSQYGVPTRRLLDVEFPWLSKMKLDEIRSSVRPTLKGHHYYKVCGAKISSAVDMAEKLLSMGAPAEQVRALFEQTIASEYPVEGNEVDMIHVKLDGNVYHLGKAVVEAYDEGERFIRLSRVLRGGGVYDGLRIVKEEGDYAITEAKLGDWYLKTQYFSRIGRCKGLYVNINTPTELYPHCIRYIDLELDICVEPGGPARLVDEEKLKKAVEEGIVGEEVQQIVERKVQEVLHTFASPML